MGRKKGRLCSMKEARRRWSDIQYRHEHGTWPGTERPTWVGTVLKRHFGNRSFSNIGEFAVCGAAMEDIIVAVIDHVDTLEAYLKTLDKGGRL